MTTRVFPDNSTLTIDTTNRDWSKRVTDPVSGEPQRVPRFYRLHRMLTENGMGLNIAPFLEARVQDKYPSSTPINISSPPPTFKAILLLNATPDSTFSRQPDAQLGHEFGHAAMEWMFWQPPGGYENERDYLQARGLMDVYEVKNPRLNSAYHWSLDEIAAEDWRLINGSPLAISQRDRHMNPDIPDPRTLPELVDLLHSWRELM